MKKKRKQHAHRHGKRKARVDLKNNEVHVGSKVYCWKGDEEDCLEERKWYRHSKKSIRFNGRKIRFVKVEDREETDGNGEENVWHPVKVRVRNRKTIRKLNRFVDHALDKRDKREEKAERKAARKRKEQDELLRKMRDEKLEAEYAESEQQETPQQSPAESAIKRTKYGVRLTSNDGKHYFNIGVYKSKHYPGYSTVYFFAAGKRLVYTLDKYNMKAFREEVARGVV